MPIAGATRSNIALAEPDGTLTKINAPGPEAAPPEESALLLETVRAPPPTRPGSPAAAASRAASHPSGTPTWSPARTRPAPASPSTPRARRCSRRCRARPDVVKPNADELAEAVGRPLRHPRRRGQGRRGAARAGRAARYWPASARTASSWSPPRAPSTAPPAVAAVRSNVGAGDASLAGFLIAGGTGPDALAAALAHGAAAVQLPGSVMPTPADLRPDQVTLTQDLPLDLPLRDAATAAFGP